jgi:hypothetical protein
MTTVRKCSEDGCDEKHYGRGYCSKHYWLHSKAGDLNSATEIVAIPQPPKPPVDKKRCHALVNGKRCIRGIRAKGLCAAHWHEAEDRQLFQLRERPIESTVRDYAGREDLLGD